MQKKLFPARSIAPGHRSVRDQLDALLRESVTAALALAQGEDPAPAQKAGAAANRALTMLDVAPRHGRIPQAIRDAVFELQAAFGAVAWRESAVAASFPALCKAIGEVALEWSSLRGRHLWIRRTTLLEQKGRCARSGCTRDARDVIAVPSEGPGVYRAFCRSDRLKQDAPQRCARAVSTKIERQVARSGQLRLGL